MPGTLILCAGPIGNLGDAAPRLGEALASADVVYAEDTRRAAVLLGRLGVSVPTRSYFVGNEAERAVEIGERLAAGETVAVLTDAGTPAIADPGLSAVRAAVEAGAVVTGVPGPSAVTLALAVSGLPSDRFAFEGFLPRKGAKRTRRLQGLGAEERTTVLFSAPGRLVADLSDLLGAAGPDRPVVVCRELTKLHEEVWRGTLAEAAASWEAREVRGEVTVVLGGAEARPAGIEEAVAMAASLIDQGVPASKAAASVAATTGVARRSIYDGVVRRRSDGRGAAGDGGAG
ncbi:MAG: 16S rRNA (cytidine(1402)-2'-O)-methyltransferase [Actinobacteria bacterium]|nr:16S rRNA (cytidine(1402)-2'-O)-methyltransferase [Actinomycetota bacterium]